MARSAAPEPCSLRAHGFLWRTRPIPRRYGMAEPRRWDFAGRSRTRATGKAPRKGRGMRVLGLSLGLAACLALAAAPLPPILRPIPPAHAQTVILKLALDWRFEGPAAPFLVAADKGYFTAEGLDVTIEPGTGSV